MQPQQWLHAPLLHLSVGILLPFPPTDASVCCNGSIGCVPYPALRAAANRRRCTYIGRLGAVAGAGAAGVAAGPVTGVRVVRHVSVRASV